MSPTSYRTALLRDTIGAGSRGRTGTRGEPHGILSPGRLPIPPFRRSHLLFDSIPYKRAFVNTEFQFFEAFRWIFLNHIALPFSHSPVIIAAHGKHYCRIHEKDTRQYSVFPYCTASVIVSVLWIMATDHRHGTPRCRAAITGCFALRKDRAVKYGSARPPLAVFFGHWWNQSVIKSISFDKTIFVPIESILTPSFSDKRMVIREFVVLKMPMKA